MQWMEDSASHLQNLDISRLRSEAPRHADPNHLNDINKGVELTVETLERFGGKAQVFRADKGNPVVHGVFGNDSSRPTVSATGR